MSNHGKFWPSGIAMAVLLAAAQLAGCGSTEDSSSITGNQANPVAGDTMTGGSTSTSTYNVSATVTGLAGQGLVLELNGGQDLPVTTNGTVTFQTGLASGTAYTVAVATQPATRREICGVTNGTGAISQANVTNVAIDCSMVAGFLYQTASPNQNNDQVASQLLSYGISADTGALIPFATSLVSGSPPARVVTSPGGAFLIVSNLTNGTDLSDGSISVYAVDADSGALTPVSSIVTENLNPLQLVMSAQGYLFVFGGNPGAPGFAGFSTSVNTYALNLSSGTLTPTGTPLTFSDSSVTNLAVRPDGKFLYVMNGNFSSNTPVPVTLTAYAIDAATGVLTPGAAMTWMMSWNNTTAPGDTMAIDSTGRFMYLASEQGNTIQAQATVLPYAIDPGSGALTPIGSGIPVPSNADILMADPTGKYLYVLNSLNSDAASDTVLALAIDQGSGVLSPLGAPLETGGPPSAFICDPSGQFAYVGLWFNEYSTSPNTDLAAFSMSTAGQLLPGGTSGLPGATGGLAIVE